MASNGHADSVSPYLAHELDDLQRVCDMPNVSVRNIYADIGLSACPSDGTYIWRTFRAVVVVFQDRASTTISRLLCNPLRTEDFDMLFESSTVGNVCASSWLAQIDDTQPVAGVSSPPRGIYAKHCSCNRLRVPPSHKSFLRHQTLRYRAEATHPVYLHLQ